jgi:hypothetical protein
MIAPESLVLLSYFDITPDRRISSRNFPRICFKC